MELSEEMIEKREACRVDIEEVLKKHSMVLRVGEPIISIIEVQATVVEPKAE